ncbi:MAG: 30S ribosomal protein S12 methylthiotransferase RimO [Chitinophagaceae bacterium]|nr:30S ribosomal protein S12 methylthiotransferase RimO [Chitinophagaceae bacterium]MCZ2397241.1 30S ribosomal protein S12 methylthiotransferase RimO [Chitinophagales bacterium]
MKTKLRKEKVNIITLGCSKNLVDSEVMGGHLKRAKIDVKHESKKLEHNISIINTCGFIDLAKEESINTILEQVELKKQGKIEKVYVTGCLSERYKHNLEEEIPEVDAFFGTGELRQLLAKFKIDYKAELVGERMLATPKHYAYMKISEGCNRTCAFCAIPLMRGKHTSKPIEDIVAEAEMLVQKGVKEIMLIGQELTYYGLDIYKSRELPQLMDKLAGVPGLEWIRLHYAYPSKFPIEIIDVMKDHQNICNYLDMPVQHASDNILKAMRRQITRSETEDLIGEIRSRIPDICLRTTLIAGFPGETDEDVEEVKQFLQKIEFDRVGIFTYSHEENTAAYELKDNIPQEVKQQRAEDIMEVQRDISYEKNKAKEGKIFKVIVDKKESGKYLGRTEFDSVEVDNEIIIDSPHKLNPGDFVNVRITRAYDYDMEGVVV